MNLVKTSNSGYDNKIAHIKRSLDQVNQNQITTADIMIVLRIMSTVKLMEKYQNNVVGDRSIKSLLKKQDELIKKITKENRKYEK